MTSQDTSNPTPTVESLISALQDKSSWVRVDAVKALSTLRDPRAVEPLAALVKHLDKNTQIAAIKALGEIGDPKAIEPLTVALEHESYETYDAIKEVLTKLGATDIVQSVAISRAKSEATEENKEAGRSLLLWGAGLLGISLLCTFGSYGFASVRASQRASVSGFGSAQYLVFTGPMVIGGILLIVGFFRSQGAISVGKIIASVGIGLFGFFDIFGIFEALFDPGSAPGAVQGTLFLGMLVASLVLATRLAVRSWRDIVIVGILIFVIACLISPYLSAT